MADDSKRTGFVRDRARAFGDLIGLDKAIVMTLLARGLTALGSVVTVLLIVRYLSPVKQGFYYTLWSMVALQVIFELGFTFVVLQMAAHERAHVEIGANGTIHGPALRVQRLASVLQKSLRWYFIAAVLMLLTLTPGGLLFFRTHQPAGAHEVWRWPWIATVLASTFTFQMDPMYAFLEGCGQVKEVATMRFGQSLFGTLMAWTALACGFGLYAPPMVMTGHVAVGSVFLWRRRHLLGPLLRMQTEKNGVNWRREIWPFQWKIAISWLCTYLTSSVFTPIVFSTRGAVEAGRMGMSLNICASLGALAIAWMNTKAAPFGAMIARGDRSSLDRLFFRTLWQSSAMFFVGASALAATLFLLPFVQPGLALRILKPGTFLLLLSGFFVSHIVQCLAIYLRSHKIEPFLVLSIVVASLICGGAYLCSRIWGPIGIAVVFSSSMLAVALFWALSIFVATRNKLQGV